MLVYTDLLCGDQVLSDSFPTKPLVYNGEEIPGIMVAQSKLVPKDIGEVNTGANASAEGGGDEVDDSVEMVCNIKDPLVGFGYEGPNDIKAKDFGVLFKSYCVAVKNKITEAGEKPGPFMKSAKAFAPFLKAEFKNFEIYSPKSFSAETFIIGWWDDEANTVGAPKFLYFKNALKEEKY
mmetsp:Transcript_8726/g.11021  ORF Transcript_8726/g.11021 Transcript_8726/m.11021 type:complete len:179 (+) Transcript_8726:157-693(+)|eukprot:CAMPEP_0204844630 /NCGR_PEP_ID=MMETSP1347-20130617/385_1 /ASSEMBLY_ACC=CAM_ASM_000690 /TAXON_ID=215587 /ORGANISM="Aplanochytrium stocchinoi, Strain GSBS06" /LENGTH=178 /DNA_ID=CAMNT_0051984109 /DNA_START=33 /DNA_END=569 /DNA_ORIENTATION=+